MIRTRQTGARAGPINFSDGWRNQRRARRQGRRAKLSGGPHVNPYHIRPTQIQSRVCYCLAAYWEFGWRGEDG
jgi:hypothetical protein